MNLFNGTWIMMRKELNTLFSSPLIYILAGIFNILVGWLFFNYIVASKSLTTLNIYSAVITPLFGNMNFIFLFLAPLITMKSFAEEKKNRTLDLLMNSKLSSLQIVLGKYLSNIVSVLFILLFTGVLLIIAFISGADDWPLMLTSYLGVILSVSSYLIVGMFGSSITENQIVSAMISFGILLGLMLLVLTANASNNVIVAQLFSYLSISFHIEGFLRGSIRSYDLIYYISFISLGIFLILRSLDSRNW